MACFRVDIGFTLALTVASPSLDCRSTVVPLLKFGCKSTQKIPHMQIYAGLFVSFLIFSDIYLITWPVRV